MDFKPSRADPDTWMKSSKDGSHYEYIAVYVNDLAITFGSEFVAARIATDQIIDLRYTLIYLGVPIRSKSYMFGDNKSVVDSASIPTSTPSKKSTLGSYHRVRGAIAAGYLQFNWKDGMFEAPKNPFSNLHFRNTTKIAGQVLALNFALLALLLSFSLNYELIIYFQFCASSFNHMNSTSLSFSEFSELLHPF